MTRFALMNAQTATFKFTVEDYLRLYEVGILDEQDRIELLNGDLIIMQAIGSRHAITVLNLNFELVEQSRRRFAPSPQNPFELDQLSLPQPDFVVIPFNPGRVGHIKATEISLVVEVSDSSLRFDRETKLAAYARVGIPEYWIVNLVEDMIEVYRQPQGEAYLECFVHGLNATVSPLAFPDVVLEVSSIVAAR